MSLLSFKGICRHIHLKNFRSNHLYLSAFYYQDDPFKQKSNIPCLPNFQYPNHRELYYFSKFKFHQKPLIHLQHFHFSTNAPKSTEESQSEQIESIKSRIKKKPDKTPTTSSKLSYFKYINPIYVIPKITQLLYKVVYVIFDSIIHPSKGKERLKNLWTHIKHDAKHYWHGAKLLGADIKNCSKILAKLVRGKSLTYREKRQLRRTTLDILRFVPFAFFIIIPAFEIFIPVYLYLFPNALPTRFATEDQKKDRRKKQLELRLNLATFLEDTLEQYAQDVRNREKLSKESEESLELVIKKMKNKEDVKNEQILQIARLFGDNITLDNASATTLSNLCGYMGMNSYGPAGLLRLRLENRIKEIKREDKGIRKEGVENIPLDLLKQLLRERGMRADLQEWVLRANMKKWLELSLDNEVPITMLIMSRVFSLQHVPGDDETILLKDTIANIGDSAVSEMYVESAGIVDSLKEKLVIDKQAELIEEDKKLQEQLEKETEKAKELKEKELKKEFDKKIESKPKDSDKPEYEKENAKIANLVNVLEHLIEQTDKDHEFLQEKKRLENLKSRLDKTLNEDDENIDLQQIDDIAGELKDMTSEEAVKEIHFDEETQTFGIDEEKALDKLKEDKIKEKLSKQIKKLIDSTDSSISVKDEKKETEKEIEKEEELITLSVAEIHGVLKERLKQVEFLQENDIENFLNELELSNIMRQGNVVDTDDLKEAIERFLQKREIDYDEMINQVVQLEKNVDEKENVTKKKEES